MIDSQTVYHRAQARCAEMYGPQGVCQVCFRTEILEALREAYPDIPGDELLEVVRGWQRSGLEPEGAH